MLKLIVCIFIMIAVCWSQEHLTCLRTDEVLSQQSAQTTQRTLQGPPGKRGAKGQVGSRGIKGQKGEPGIPENPQMNMVRDKLNSLTQQLDAIKNLTRKTQEVIDAVKNGLLVNSYFYVYKLTSTRQSWQESRQLCRNWEGDLAVHGVQTLENRRKLFQSFSIGYHYWIGASDMVSEGNWTWLNGEPASSSELIWPSGEPNGGRTENCVFVVAQLGHTHIDRVHDVSCAIDLQGLCEKKI